MTKKDYDAIVDTMVNQGATPQEAIQSLIDMEFSKYVEKQEYLQRLLDIKTRVI